MGVDSAALRKAKEQQHGKYELEKTQGQDNLTIVAYLLHYVTL